MREGSHRLIRWKTEWSSQTGACQAGLLHDFNDDMPAFRWWEKDRNAPILSNHPKDTMEIERRVSNGQELLAVEGASRANLLSGDAPYSLLTMSTVLKRDRPGRIGQDYFAYFANPYNVSRTLVLFVADVVSELWSASEQRRRDVQPRVPRPFLPLYGATFDALAYSIAGHAQPVYHHLRPRPLPVADSDRLCRRCYLSMSPPLSERHPKPSQSLTVVSFVPSTTPVVQIRESPQAAGRCYT